MANDYAGTADLSGAVPSYYNKMFLERLVPGPVMMDYATKKPLPANNGTVVYFPRMTTPSTTVSAMRIQYSAGREPISTDNVVSVQVSATLEKFGYAVAIQDVTQLAAINSTVEEATRALGDQAKNVLDKRILEEAYGTSATPTGAGFSCFAFNTVGLADLGASTSAFGTYVGTVEYKLAASTLRSLYKKMKTRLVPTLDDGFYALVVHPNSSGTLQSDTSWQNAYIYTNAEAVRKAQTGVAGAYSGIKVVIDENIKTSANGSAGDTLYYSVLLGHGALGVTELDGGVSFTTTSGADKYDPINEFITLGWKALMVPVRLNVSSGLVVITADGN